MNCGTWSPPEWERMADSFTVVKLCTTMSSFGNGRLFKGAEARHKLVADGCTTLEIPADTPSGVEYRCLASPSRLISIPAPILSLFRPPHEVGVQLPGSGTDDICLGDVLGQCITSAGAVSANSQVDVCLCLLPGAQQSHRDLRDWEVIGR